MVVDATGASNDRRGSARAWTSLEQRYFVFSIATGSFNHLKFFSEDSSP